MKSEIAARLKLKYSPVAIQFGEAKPDGALEFIEGRRGCVAAMLTAAAKGRTAVFSRANCGCAGGRVGLGFGNSHLQFPGGFDYFLSTGRGEGYPEGEAYKRTPELVKTFTDVLPYTDIPYQYVVFRPLAEAEASPAMVVFYANPDQLSALVVLANYDRPGNENVIIPFGAGCHSTCLIPWDEASKEAPRAVVGMTDITARPYIDADLLSFSMPYGLFREMEDNVAGSFLDNKDWQKVAARIPDSK